MEGWANGGRSTCAVGRPAHNWWRPRGSSEHASQRRGYTGGRNRLRTAAVGRGSLYKSAFLKTEPKFILRMCFGMSGLCKNEDGFGRQSEAKLKGT